MPLGNAAKNGAEQPEDEQNGRREFLRRALIELPLIGLAVTTPIRKRIFFSQREPPKAESVPNAAVSKYTVQILAAARRLLDEKYQIDTTAYYEAAFFAGAAAGVELTIRRDQKLPPQETQSDKPLHRKLTELVNSCQDAILARKPFSKSRRLLFASAGAALLSSVIDNYSTVGFAQVMQDPRFIEYGFGQYFYEENTDLIHHPTTEEVLSRKSLARSVPLVLACYFFPAIGIALGFTTPFIYLNNTGGAKWMEIGYLIGDSVKGKLQAGQSDSGIKGYLKTVTLEDLVR